MRIIAGEFRGRKLLSPESDLTRPITDRVKQSLFDIVAPDLPGSTVYDCFAGTGSMGLESLSRGALRTVFFESDRSAILRLKQNIAILEVQDQAQVLAGDLFKWFAMARPTADLKCNIIFLDPPYRFVVEKSELIRTLLTQMFEHHLKPGGYVVFRHESRGNLMFADAEEFDLREYGGMKLRFLRARSN